MVEGRDRGRRDGGRWRTLGGDMAVLPSRAEFIEIVRRERAGGDGGREGAEGATLVIPIGLRLMGDQLTPVLAYRRLVVEDERTAPSFLFESVEGGGKVGRYSLVGAQPEMEVIASEGEMRVLDRRGGAGGGAAERVSNESDPLRAMAELTRHWRVVEPSEGAREGLPGTLWGGWVGYAGYDTARYAEPEKLGWDRAPTDDRGLADLHFGLYTRVVVFDHARTLAHVVASVEVGAGAEAGECYDAAVAGIEATAQRLQRHSKPLRSGLFEPELVAPGVGGMSGGASSNMDRGRHAAMVERAKEYIRAGDIFQVVVGQRFTKRSKVDPFDVYRALRAVNPSPYMGYLQAQGCILVASSPEILCRVRREDSGAAEMVVTNRPLAGTRRRGRSAAEDAELARELLADEKERAEHIMLVDLGRNDVGRVSRAGSVRLPALMEVERYSHVMHISSTVTGALGEGKDCWDALRAALPVGTISGAPKVRAMQIIDELEPVRRGPYGGGFGFVGLAGEMDIALTLRTIVVPTRRRSAAVWEYHIQAAGGIVADSDPAAEYQETVNKAAALVRAIEIAERAFGAGIQDRAKA